MSLLGKIFKGVLVAAAIAVQFVPGVGTAIGALTLAGIGGTAAAVVGTITALGISAGISLAQGALTPSPKVALSQLERLNTSVNPTAGRKMVFGKRVAMATDIRYVEPSGDKQEYIDYIICVAAHKVSSIDEIWLDDKKAWDSGTVQGGYVGYLTVGTVLEGNAGNTIAINGGAKWGSTRRLTGCAYVHLRIKRTGNGKKAESPFASGLTSRMTIIGDGMPLYDPRLDSTVPGGAGSQRADDCSTWAFDAGGDEQGANTALQTLAVQLGWRINGKVSVGIGTPPARLDRVSYIVAADACDATVTTSSGTQKRYISAGVFSETDGPQSTLSGLMSACNGALVDTGGKLGLKIRINDLDQVTIALDDHDVLSSGTWEPFAEINEAYNVVRGRYCDPSNNSLFQLVDYPEIRLDSADGQDRILTLDLPLTDDAARAQRIAKQVLQRLQYRGKFTATFSIRGWNAKVGDVLTVTLAAAGWEEKLFRVESQTIMMDGTCPMILREENEAIYAWDGDDQAPVTPIAPTAYDPLNNPFILGIAEVQESADEALALLAAIVDDDVLDRSEKPEIVKQFNALIFEQGGIDTQATAFGITTEKTTYDTAISALTTYLTGLSPAYNDYSQNTSITRATFISKFTDAYTARTVLLNKMSAIAKANADTALAQITAIVADGVLDKSEKPDVVKEYNGLTAEQSGIDTQATAYGITTEKTTYDTAVSALTTYLTGLSPAYNSYTTDTTIVRATFITKFTDVYTSRQALLNKIAELASNKRNVTGGGNRVPFSKFETGWAAYWGNLFNPSGIVTGVTAGTANNRRYLRMTVSSSGAAITPSLGSLTAGFFPVDGARAERIAVQVALESTGVLGGTCTLVIHYYNAAGSHFSAPTVATTTGLKTFGALLGDFVVVPAGAVKAQLEVYFTTTGSGAGTASLIEPTVTQASQDQILLPAFSPGPNSNDGATLGAPNATDPVGAITAGDVAAGVGSGGTINPNKVVTTSITNNNVTQTFGQSTAGTLTGSGAFAWQDAETYTYTPSEVADLVLWAVGKQSYAGAPPMAWDMRFTVDGVAYGTPAGGAGGVSDSVSCMAIVTGLSTTPHTIKLQYRADNTNLSLVARSMAGIGRMK